MQSDVPSKSRVLSNKVSPTPFGKAAEAREVLRTGLYYFSCADANAPSLNSTYTGTSNNMDITVLL